MASGSRIFIGSSVESKKYAECIGDILNDFGLASIYWWDDKCFPLKVTAITSLERLAEEVDGAILIAGPDDKKTQRGDEFFEPSINIMLEYGLLLGRLSRSQVAIALVDGAKFPSDLAGVNYIRLPSMQEGDVSQAQEVEADQVPEKSKITPLIHDYIEKRSNPQERGRSLNPHLEAIYNRSKEPLRFIIPALDLLPVGVGEINKDTGISAPSEGSRLTMMTSLEGMAYGWLLKAFSPFMNDGEQIDCIPANRGSINTRTANFIIGGPSTNILASQILARMRPAIITSRGRDYGDVITHKGTEFKTQYQSGFRNLDFSFLIYNPRSELYVCTGTSPFGTAGAVSMLAEPQEGEGTHDISTYIMNCQPFTAIGEVEILTETYWKFKRVLRIDSEVDE